MNMSAMICHSMALFALVKVGLLRPFNPKELYLLGWVHRLRQIRAGDTAQQHKETIEPLAFVIENFSADELNQKYLPNSIEKANQLRRWITSLLKAAPTWPITQDFIDLLLDKGLLSAFESALTMDLDHLPSYLLERKRGYAVEVLVQSIEEVLPEDDRAWLSEFARDNMQEAGACLAFHRYTACGYHMARAVENIARIYYEVVKGQSQRMKPKPGEPRGRDRNLAQIAGELDDVYRNWGGASEPGLLSLIVPTLKNFCRIYRHPLSHADLELKELYANDAEIAFGHAITAISTMIEDVRVGGPHFAFMLSWPK